MDELTGFYKTRGEGHSGRLQCIFKH